MLEAAYSQTNIYKVVWKSYCMRKGAKAKKALTVMHFIVGGLVLYTLIILLLAGLNAVGKANQTPQDIFHARQVQCDYNLQTAKSIVKGNFNTGICIFYKGTRYVFVIDQISHNNVRLLQYSPSKLFMFNPGMTRMVDLDGDDGPDVSFALVDYNAQGAAFEIQIFAYADVTAFDSVPPTKEEPVQAVPVMPEQEFSSVTVPVGQQELPPVLVQDNAAQTWNIIIITGIFLAFAVLVIGVVKRRSIFHQ